MTEFAQGSGTEQAKKALEEARSGREHVAAAAAALAKGKPTPTQEENDLAVLGAHILKHDDDGSGPDPGVVTRHQEAGHSNAPYQTRQGGAAHAPAPRPPPPRAPHE